LKAVTGRDDHQEIGERRHEAVPHTSRVFISMVRVGMPVIPGVACSARVKLRVGIAHLCDAGPFGIIQSWGARVANKFRAKGTD
jgi:hypothetical protein